MPPDLELLPGATGGSRADQAGVVYYLVRKVPVVSGRDLRNARPSLDENNRPAVSFTLTQAAASIRQLHRREHRQVSRDRARQTRRLGAVIEGKITDEGRIAGNFTQQEAADLALTLRSGALPAALTYLEERTIGPSLGADSIRAGIIASLTGLGLVVVFMLVYYKLSGINAIVAMVVNLIVLLR